MEKFYDIVVIGAGAIGSSVAYHLQEAGFSVALLEKKDVASGSSSHCDAVGLICDKLPGIDTKMGQASIDYFGVLAKKFKYDFEYNPKGCLYICETKPEFDAASEYCAKQNADGYPLRMVRTKELTEMEPYIAKDLYGALYTPSSGSVAVNPYKLCFAFVHEAKELGLDCYTYCNISKINTNAETNAVESIETNYGTHKGGYPAIEALTVLSYDKRRSAFFRNELYHALKILDEGHISFNKMENLI